MDNIKSLDKYKLIAALLRDVFTSYGSVFDNTRILSLTLKKIEKRIRTEGTGFLTKTLPALGRAFDKALAEVSPLNCTALGFKPYCDTKLPKLFGELFSRVLDKDGYPLSSPCINSIKQIRQLLYLFYKYELPYSDEQEQHVLGKFYGIERELETVSARLRQLSDSLADFTTSSRGGAYNQKGKSPRPQEEVARRARSLLKRLFARFDPKDIFPRHGPGAVATKQRLWDKYLWTNISAKITRVYPLDEYFYASLGHVCDRYKEFELLGQADLPARVCLVPKDSRGPRLISCEPVDYQWVQQGLGSALVRWTESHKLTKFVVFFSDQGPNRIGALYGSETGKYATLDLNEASDRVSLELVRLLFPPHLYEFLESCRSSSTELPNGLILPLWKFAPMGSSLCFPILALTTWAILAAAAPDAETRESLHVYGDDVIVPTAFAEDAIEQLESFGLKINRDKSCTKGFFRESCGMDAYKGKDVTPVRLRTVWSSKPSPESYSSWIAYANSFWDRKCYAAYDYIVSRLHHVYGAIPAKDMVNDHAPSLAYVPEDKRPTRWRTNHDLQKREWYVRTLVPCTEIKEIDGWSMLLRYFAERVGRQSVSSSDHSDRSGFTPLPSEFSVSSYTRRGASKLARRWR